MDDFGQDKALKAAFADESVFELTRNGHSVKPYAYDPSDPLQATAQLTQDEFVGKMRDLVYQEKQ